MALPQGGAGGDGAARPRADSGEMEPIVFRDVHPLYAVSDIRGSSTHRAWAIQADLLTQLGLAREVLRAAYDDPAPAHPRPAHPSHRRARGRDRGDAALGRRDRGARASSRPTWSRSSATCRPSGPRCASTSTPTGPRWTPASAGLRAAQGVRRERDRINDTISSYIDLEEQAAQGDVPPLLREAEDRRGRLHDLPGRRPPRGRDLRPALSEEPAPLAAHGRVRGGPAGGAAEGPAAGAPGHHEPDPDPARPARHPLPRRREALRRGRRLQRPLRDHQEADRQGDHPRHHRAPDPARQDRPGLLAPSEAAEWREYIEYLQRLGYLTREVEELELDELQGAQGLRALRVTVDLANRELDVPSTRPR